MLVAAPSKGSFQQNLTIDSVTILKMRVEGKTRHSSLFGPSSGRPTTRFIQRGCDAVLTTQSRLILFGNCTFSKMGRRYLFRLLIFEFWVEGLIG